MTPTDFDRLLLRVERMPLHKQIPFLRAYIPHCQKRSVLRSLLEGILARKVTKQIRRESRAA